MTAIPTTSRSAAAGRSDRPLLLSAGWSRALLALGMTAAVAVGFSVTVREVAARSAAEAGEDLTRLLRAMAALKVVMAAGASGAVLWRLGSPIPLVRPVPAYSPRRHAAFPSSLAAGAAGTSPFLRRYPALSHRPTWPTGPSIEC